MAHARRNRWLLPFARARKRAIRRARTAAPLRPIQRRRALTIRLIQLAVVGSASNQARRGESRIVSSARRNLQRFAVSYCSSGDADVVLR